MLSITTFRRTNSVDPLSRKPLKGRGSLRKARKGSTSISSKFCSEVKRSLEATRRRKRSLSKAKQDSQSSSRLLMKLKSMNFFKKLINNVSQNLAQKTPF